MTPRQTGYKTVQTLHGDTLQRVAARELGDASLWPGIAYLNGLAPPYLTDDPAQVAEGVRLTGSRLLVPVDAPVAPADVGTRDPFGSDVRLNKGLLTVEGGDLALVSGVDNLRQALGHVVVTEPGELLFHPRYGCGLRRFIGASNSRANALVAGGLVKRALGADHRVVSVREATTEINGAVLRIEATAVAVDGSTIEVKA